VKLVNEVINAAVLVIFHIAINVNVSVKPVEIHDRIRCGYRDDHAALYLFLIIILLAKEFA